MRIDLNPNRRPYASKKVLDGLLSLSSRTRAETESELVAMQWIKRTNAWRAVSSAMPNPHDAECVSSEIAGLDSSSPAVMESLR